MATHNKPYQIFQNIHGLAIRRNEGNVAAMKDTTHAILDHYSSTPDNPNTANARTGMIADLALIVIWLQEKRTTVQSKIPHQKQLLRSLKPFKEFQRIS